MKIYHYSNSFISVRSLSDHIVCDPWMGKANTGGWQSFPEYPVDRLARHLSDARWVYISHLHDDHFHPSTLNALNLIDREFIIKRFQQPVLRERLKKLGVTRIHELDAFTINSFGSIELVIFPQMTSTSSGLDDHVNYDLDTSIAFKAKDIVFFNQVDNPLSTFDITQIRDWILNHFGAIDIACSMSGAAGEYPHLFLGIDQADEKQRIVDNAGTELINFLQLLKPKYYFPAGGTYLIPGWLSVFSDNIAQPSFKEIQKWIQQSNLATIPLDLEGGYSIEVSAKKMCVPMGPEVTPVDANKQSVMHKHSADTYDYELVLAPPLAFLLEVLHLAREHWLSKVRQGQMFISQSIGFEIYSKLALKDGGLDQAHKLVSWQLFQPGESHAGDLTIFIDQRALYGCLIRRFVWNGVLGSLCLYNRKPNRHFPTDVLSLNYFTLTHQQCRNFELASPD